MASVRPQPGVEVFGDVPGAFVNILAWADSLDDYRHIIQNACTQLGLELVEIEDMQPFSERLRKWEVAEDLAALAGEVRTCKEVRFSTFHTFEENT